MFRQAGPPGVASSASTAARRASASLLGSASLFAVMAIGTRLVSARIPGAQIALVRFVVGTLTVLALVAAGRVVLRPRRWGWLAARGAAGGCAVFLYFSCIEHVGVGVATLLNYTAPAWAMLLGWWWLDERPRRTAIAALGLTLVGVVFVVGGGMRAFHLGAWQAAAVASAILSGIAVTSIRASRRPGPDGVPESAWTVFASFTMLGMVATLPGVFSPLGRWVAPSPSEWALLVAIGAVSLIAQLIMTAALEHVTASTSGVIHQLTVILTLAGGAMLFGEPVTASLLVGSVLTVAGVVWTIASAAPTSSPPAPPPGSPAGLARPAGS